MRANREKGHTIYHPESLAPGVCVGFFGRERLRYGGSQMLSVVLLYKVRRGRGYAAKTEAYHGFGVRALNAELRAHGWAPPRGVAALCAKSREVLV